MINHLLQTPSNIQHCPNPSMFNICDESQLSEYVGSCRYVDAHCSRVRRTTRPHSMPARSPAISAPSVPPRVASRG